MQDIYALSDSLVQKRIGEKVRAVRLRQNITQRSLAEMSSVSLSSIKKVENGEIGSFDTFIRILRTLGLLEEIQSLCEEEQLSPAEYYEMVNNTRNHRRKRASGTVSTYSIINKEESEW